MLLTEDSSAITSKLGKTFFEYSTESSPAAEEFITLEMIQSVSQLLGETLDQCNEVEEDIRQVYDAREEGRDELVRSLSEFAKLRSTFFACLRRLSVAYNSERLAGGIGLHMPSTAPLAAGPRSTGGAESNIFVQYGLKISERSEIVSRGLISHVKSLRFDNQSITQSLQSQGGRAMDFFTVPSANWGLSPSAVNVATAVHASSSFPRMSQSEAITTIASWCLQEKSAEIFTSYLATQFFSDFISIEEDPSSVTAYVSNVLKSHLPTQELIETEAKYLYLLAGLEREVLEVIAQQRSSSRRVSQSVINENQLGASHNDTMYYTLPSMANSIGPDRFSVNQLIDAAVRLRDSHNVCIPRLLKLFLDDTKKSEELESLLSLHRSALEMVAEIKSRLRRLLEATVGSSCVD
eukprot:Protomagalhaensia_sp_Gyna_25__1037@NODE_14_length_8401_cov_301_835924_g10_i0_p2_GENE_NODE_14_length_8401_cov_301_835924_g10_i0NODE_14_length_8401_cov_301_835924_g10_i0_p2_ORF_typecomplete_len408_score50_32DUF3408/PF11888_8/0_31DUF3408/PF11888_8/6_6e03DUF3408/PF11888_8/1_3e04RhoGEF/PF00621_20/1_4e03RhoGEF/PF00621_20/0_45_NODE_14_length_8401_cov_301_835924_g10_i09392162